MGSHNPPPFAAQRSRWHSVPSPIDVGPPNHPLQGPVSLLAHRLVSTPLRGSDSSLAHHPVSSSDTICNKPKPTSSKYCPFWAFPFGLPFNVFKTRERFPHPYKECFVLLPNRCGISQSTPFRGPASSLALVPFSNRCRTPQSTPFRAHCPYWHTALCPPPFEAQTPCWHIAQCLALIPFVTAQAHR